MKRFIIVTAIMVACALGVTYLVLYKGLDLWLLPHASNIDASFRVDGTDIVALDEDGKEHVFTMRGVDIGGAEPGHFATEQSTDRETYERWFDLIASMGGNTVRVYMLMAPSFYEALAAHNEDAAEPLYLLQGVYLYDYAAYSHMDGFDDGYMGTLRENAYTAIDAIHGRKIATLGNVSASGSYTTDVSAWTIDYALGVPWDTRSVAYTDETAPEKSSYTGAYVATTEDASPFEAMLAQVANDILRYETIRYGQQRLVGIVNSTTTDPFTYPERIQKAFNKYTSIDLEHIQQTDSCASGIFALYHVYPFKPEFGRNLEDGEAPFTADADGGLYGPYLEALVDHHSCPVVVGEYGVYSSRAGVWDAQGEDSELIGISETHQAELIVEAYEDIVDAGCAGSLLYEWSDEWARRTWNTVYATDQLRTPYWSDAQTVDQAYGVLAFDPGEAQTVCVVDGMADEWSGVAATVRDGDAELKMTYDERYLYLAIIGDGVTDDMTIDIPIDTTAKSGSTTAELLDTDELVSGMFTYDDLKDRTQASGLTFGRAADFIVRIDGSDSCVYVQERYDSSRAMMLMDVEGRDPYVDVPEKDSPLFKPITLAHKTLGILALEQPLPTTPEGTIDYVRMTDFSYDLEGAITLTGALREGNADPDSEAYDSCADFCTGSGCIEVRIPWEMLNFSDPSQIRIHDDYYEHFGVEDLEIDALHIGLSVRTDAAEERKVAMARFDLEGWGDDVSYHERLKPAYAALKQAWAARDKADGEGNAR